MFKKWLIIAISALMLSTAAGCGNEVTTHGETKLQVTATTGQIADVVQHIGGEHVEVASLMGPGVDPHLYQASQGDIRKLSGADIIFYNGLHLEGKMGDIFEKMSKDKPVVAVGETIPKDLLLQDSGNKNAHDPHVWFDIDLWKYVVETVRDELIKLDPENEASYKRNATEYLEQLDELKAYAVEQINTIPAESRVLVTAHDAFGYLGRAYGIEVMGLQGLSTNAEYGLKDVQGLVDTLILRKIKAVFIESSISEKSINAVVEGAGQKNHTVVVGGELFSDAMGKKGTEEGTYIGMYKHNIQTIVDALK